MDQSRLFNLLITPPAQAGGNRDKFIDISKGVGIILVICSHVDHSLMLWSSPFFVPLFFIISGFCTCNLVSIKKKFVKLLIPYVFFTFVVFCQKGSLDLNMIMGAIYSRFCLFPLGADDNILFMTSGNSPLWFLTSMFTSCCIYRFFQKAPHKIVMLIAFFIMSYILQFLPVLLPWSVDTAFLFAIYIALGAYVRHKELLAKIQYSFFIGLLFVYITLLCFCGEINLSVREYGNSLFILLPCSTIGSILLIKVSQLLEHSSFGNCLALIGKQSLCMFSLHLPIIYLLNKIWGPFGVDIPYLGPIITIIAALIIIYPMSLLINKYILLPLFDKVQTIRYKLDI